MSDYPREITLKDQTRATIIQTHVAMIRQSSGTVVLDAESLMQLLMAMRDNDAPEPPKLDFE
jgi:hypothetical protein